MKTVVDLVVESWGEITQSTLRKAWRKIISIPSASSVSMSTPLPGVLADLYRQADDNEDNAQSCTSVNSSQSRGCCTWRGMRIRIHHSQDDREETPISEDPEDSEPGLTSFQTMFKELGSDMDEDQIFKWLEYDSNDCGVQTLTDAEICELVSSEAPSQDPDECEEEDDTKEIQCTVFNSKAARMFEECLASLEHQSEASAYMSVLRQLHAYALAASKRMDS